jgi:hypothetical protein
MSKKLSFSIDFPFGLPSWNQVKYHIEKQLYINKKELIEKKSTIEEKKVKLLKELDSNKPILKLKEYSPSHNALLELDKLPIEIQQRINQNELTPNNLYILFSDSENKVGMQIKKDSISLKFSVKNDDFISAVCKGLKTINTIELERTPQCTCLLCKKADSSDTNSHITPMAIIKTMVGKRGREESHEIDATGGNLDVYFGSANLKNKSIEVKQDHHARNYWFCPSCETKLGVTEGTLSEWLNTKIKDDKYSNLFEKKMTSDGISYKVIKSPKVNSNLFQTFIASLVWRLSLKYRIEDNTPILSLKEEEKLRKSLHNSLSHEIKDVLNTDIKINPFIVLTTNQFKDPTKNCVFTAEFMQSPNIFSFNEYVVIFFNEEEYVTADENLNLGQIIKSQEIRNYHNDSPKIAYIDQPSWEKMLEEIMTMAAKAFIHSLVKKLKQASGNDYDSCKRKMFTLAHKIEKKDKLPFGDSCIKATQQLLNESKNNIT